MLAATSTFVSLCVCLNQQALGRAREFNEDIFVRSGRVGRYRVCNAASCERKRQTDDASPYASSHAPPPSHASPRQDVIRKWPLHRGHFFILLCPLLSLGLPRAAQLHGVLVAGILRIRPPLDVSSLVTLPPDALQVSTGPQRSVWFGR